MQINRVQLYCARIVRHRVSCWSFWRLDRMMIESISQRSASYASSPCSVLSRTVRRYLSNSASNRSSADASFSSSFFCAIQKSRPCTNARMFPVIPSGRHDASRSTAGLMGIILNAVMGAIDEAIPRRNSAMAGRRVITAIVRGVTGGRASALIDSGHIAGRTRLRASETVLCGVGRANGCVIPPALV